MQEVSIRTYFDLGTCFRFLKDASPGWPLHGEDFVFDNLKRLIAFQERFGLTVTITAATELIELIARLEPLPPDSRLSDEQATEIRKAIRALELTLTAEISDKKAFVVTPKRLDASKLRASVSSLFVRGVFDKIPDIARYDFSECGKCILFERPTAAAFHSLRGTEAVLRSLYCHLVKKKRVKDLLWKPMVDGLRARRSSPPRPLLDSLDNIRFNYRNPTQHPEMVYDIDLAQDLFSLCIEAVNRMASLLPEPKQ